MSTILLENDPLSVDMYWSYALCYHSSDLIIHQCICLRLFDIEILVHAYEQDELYIHVEC
jgi:hypothetical protein